MYMYYEPRSSIFFCKVEGEQEHVTMFSWAGKIDGVLKLVMVGAGANEPDWK